MPDTFTNKRLTRKQREHAFRVNLVLDAAREVFMRKPFAAARIEDIAKRAELSVGTLYNLFDSKEHIYKCVVSRQQDKFFEDLEAALDRAGGPRDQVHTVVKAYFKLFYDNLDIWKFHVYATSGLSSEIREELFAEVLASAESYQKRLTDICRCGIEEGEFRPGLPPELMAVAIDSIPHSYLHFIFQSNGRDVMSLLPRAIEAVDRIVGAD